MSLSAYKSPYAAARIRLRQKKFPDPKKLANALRSDEPVPPDVRQYLADLVEGKIRKPKGRPKKEFSALEKLELEGLIAAIKSAPEDEGISEHKARLAISESYGISYESLVDLQYQETRRKRLGIKS